MKKIVSLMLSVLVLSLSAVRSVQAQGVLNFATPNLAQPKRDDTTQSESDSASKTSSVIQEMQSSPSKLVQSSSSKPVQPSSGVVKFTVGLRPQQPVDPTPQAIQVFDTTQYGDRLVAVAPDDLFEGGSNSLVAKAVGSAEGTRTPDGGRTSAYYGHVDPGNGVWNLGSFSYQHEAGSPDDADRRQLERLRRQYELIQETAIAAGLRLGLVEQLNGIDLANQAPLAALDRGGYIDRLRQAYEQGLRGSEAVLQARTYSYLNPRTQQWEAPGLGNTHEGISRDQARRQGAILDAISSYQQQSQYAQRSRDNEIAHR
jgi:hypothetical protein